MLLACCIALSITMVSANLSKIPTPPPSVPEQNFAKDVIEGAWTGAFLQREWTFEFTAEHDGWSGRYMTSDGNGWHPLQELIISERHISFSIVSEPKVSFSLEVDDTSQSMSGGVTIDGIATVPFSAKRKL